jgi:hypothetical protein
MSVPEKKTTGPRRFSAADRLLIIADLFEHNRARTDPRPSIAALTRQVATREGVSSRSIRRWYGRFKRGGYAALANSPRCDIGRSRWIDRHPDAQQVILTGMSQRRSVLAIWRSVGLLYGSDETPNYSTIYKYTKRQQKAAREAASPAVRADATVMG